MKDYFFGRHVQLCQGELVKGTAYYQRMTHGAGRWDDDIMDLCFKQAGCDDGLQWTPSSKARAKRGVVMIQRKPANISRSNLSPFRPANFFFPLAEMAQTRLDVTPSLNPLSTLGRVRTTLADATGNCSEDPLPASAVLSRGTRISSISVLRRGLTARKGRGMSSPLALNLAVSRSVILRRSR